MKIQIRRGVFETNSSSTHSLQVTDGSLDDAYEYVNNRIIEKYGPIVHDSDGYDPAKYVTNLDDGTCVLHLKGIDFGDGDEESCIYAIVRTWMAKVQYIAMLFRSFKSDLPEYIKFWDDNETRYKDIHEMYSTEKGYQWNAFYDSPEYKQLMEEYPAIQNTEAYKIFIDLINETCKIHGYDVIKTSFDIDDGFTCNLPGIEYDGTKTYFSKEILADNDLFRNNLRSLLADDNKIMYFIDEAYRPYQGPSIKVY